MMIAREEKTHLPYAGIASRLRKVGPFYGGWLPLGLVLIVAMLTPIIATSANIGLSLNSAPGGVVISGTNPSYSAGFGNVNSLGVGTPGAGITVITSGVSGGVIYSTNISFVITGLVVPHQATVSAYMSSNFTKPTALILQSCYPSGSCGNGASFSTLSLSAGTPTPVIPAPGVVDGTFTASIGLFVANANGAGAVSGTDSAVVTFVATDTSNGHTSSVTLALNNPSENIQTAVGLVLATAPGGLTVAPGADYSLSFGSVDGIGVSVVPGTTVIPMAGGVIYSTPYLLQPAFSGFASTTGTLSVYVSMNFIHPTILQLQDAATAGGPYSAISNSSASPTVISTTTTTTTPPGITRYLGLFVSNVNGATAFTGSDSATLTYTLTVP